jgi:hypothetical protein
MKAPGKAGAISRWRRADPAYIWGRPAFANGRGARIGAHNPRNVLRRLFERPGLKRLAAVVEEIAYPGLKLGNV